MDHLVQLLFGHERAVFTNGQFSLSSRPHPFWLVACALLFGLLIYFVYVRPRMRLARPVLWGLVALRTALFALLVLMLLRPVIVVPSVIPRSSFVALLADDSRSMQLVDAGGGQSRLEAMKSKLLSPDGSFLARLQERFKTDLYGFSSELSKIRQGDELYGEGTASDPGGAIQEAVRRSTGIPLSAIVLVSDGSANVTRDLAAELRELRARNLPVYTVGVGSTDSFRDAELVRVNAPRRVLVGSSAEVSALVRLPGYGATKVLIAMSEDGRALKTEEFALRGDETEAVTLEIVPTAPGWHRYTFEVAALDGELTLDNNRQEALIEVVEGPLKVLYMEGEPRWEHGKLRAALSRNEKNVTLVSILRSGENKFYRQGVTGEGELVGGFPQTEEELFAYQGLVLGSVEAGFFSAEQLRNIEAFVARRGGGLLALGGRNAFDAGRYAGTPLADLLPLSLTGGPTQAAQATDRSAPVFKAVLTMRGQSHPVTRLSEDRALSQKIWNDLPPVSVPEVLQNVKPGALVLLEARRAAGGQTASVSVPLLAQQRYGRGQTLALTASDTWRWQMKMDSKSNAHETFWRQILRYLVSSAPDQWEVSAERDVYDLNERVRIVAAIRDKKFNPVSDARAGVRVTKPSGASVEIPLRFTARDDAHLYTGEFRTDELGGHRLELSGVAPALGQVTAQSEFLVAELNREFHDTAQNVDLLRRIAAETGGKYYTLDEVGSLVGDLTYRKTDNSERVTKDLWDMPVNFLLLVALLSGEWFLRKREGLA
ncbi:MAG TPA: vWA domain-containing protein [Pyrinomonadaceae bacterium]|jgi:uncharacterized membrane protein